MMPVVQFTVFGEPSPQAGMREVPIRNRAGATVGRRQITTGGVNLKSWRQEVSRAANEQADRFGQFTGPTRLEVQFRFTMPKSRPKWGHVQKLLLHVSAPDLDKLLRAVGDSLTSGGLIADDKLICQVKASKLETFDSWTGAVIRLTALDQRSFSMEVW